MNARSEVVEENPLRISNEELEKAFAPLGRKKIQQLERLKPEQIDIFPSFNQGQEKRTISSAPSSVSEPDISGENLTQASIPTLSPEQEKMAQILSAEQLRGYQSGQEYIPLSFERETEVLAESSHNYAVILTAKPEDKEESLRCIMIPKSDTILSQDGKSVTAYLKRDEESEVVVYHDKVKKKEEYRQKNEEIVADCLKKHKESVKSDIESKVVQRKGNAIWRKGKNG
jgi:hypothetical protein